MGKMMGLTFILRMLDATRSSSPPPSQSVSSSASLSWAWPSCKHPTTSSFRAGVSVYKTVNSIYFDTTDSLRQRRCSSLSSAEGEEDEEEARPPRFSTTLEEEEGEEEEEEEYSTVIRGMRSERLFFEPGSKTISMLEKEEREEEEAAVEEPKTITAIEETETVAAAGDAEAKTVPFKESVAEEMESEDPYLDFRASMQEMVVAHGLKDWECLERLLGWYLRMNGKKTHGFILGAFVDLLLGLASSLQYVPPSSSCSSCSCSRSSSSTTTITTSSSSDKSVVKDTGHVA